VEIKRLSSSSRHTRIITKVFSLFLIILGMTIQEKYDSVLPRLFILQDFSRLYKEKLTCDVEGRPFIPENVSHRISSPKPNRSRETSQTSLSSLAANNKFNQQSSSSQKEKNEDYFNSLGSANSLKSDAIKPSEG
jgi:hypothetical protein